jgi:hypothetical protein
MALNQNIALARIRTNDTGHFTGLPHLLALAPGIAVPGSC